jgi:hypothetical protein
MTDVTTLGLRTDTDNTATLNAVLANGSDPLHLTFPPGRFSFSGHVRMVNRSVRIDGAGVEGTVLSWATHGGLQFAGDHSHRFKCSDLTLTTEIEGNTAPAITVTATNTWANTIGNQLKLSDLAIRPYNLATGGYFTTGILIDGGVGGLGNASIKDVVIQGNSAVGPVEAGIRGPVLGTRGLWMRGRTYGIRLETCQLTWLDTAAEADGQPESFQWIGSSAGACRCGILAATNTWEAGIVGTLTVDRGDFACSLRGLYLVNHWQARLTGNTILNFNYPSATFTGIDFQGNCSQNQVVHNRIYPVYTQSAPATRYGVFYPGSYSTIADTHTVGCQIGVYLPQGSSQNTIRHGRNQGGTGLVNQGANNLLCENR